MKDYTEYATREITPTMAAFAEWLRAETGVEVDLRSVALAGSLRSDSRNPANQREANRESKAKAAADKAKEQLAKAQQRVKDAEAKVKAAADAAKAA
jgi:hypothetical protein